MKRENEDKCLEDEVKHRKTDTEIKTEIEKLMSGEPIGKLQGMEKAKRNEIMKMIKANDGVSLRQISRVTELSVDIVFNA